MGVFLVSPHPHTHGHIRPREAGMAGLGEGSVGMVPGSRLPSGL